METWSFIKFLQDRLSIMEKEMALRDVGSVDHAYWKGRMLSYKDALSAANGTELLRSPQEGGNIKVDAALVSAA